MLRNVQKDKNATSKINSPHCASPRAFCAVSFYNILLNSPFPFLSFVLNFDICKMVVHIFQQGPYFLKLHKFGVCGWVFFITILNGLGSSKYSMFCNIIIRILKIFWRKIFESNWIMSTVFKIKWYILSCFYLWQWKSS